MNLKNQIISEIKSCFTLQLNNKRNPSKECLFKVCWKRNTCLLTFNQLSLFVLDRSYMKMLKGIEFNDIRGFKKSIIDGHPINRGALLADYN